MMEINKLRNEPMMFLIKRNSKVLKFLLKIGFLIFLWKVLFFVIWRNPFLLNLYNQFSLVVIDLFLNAAAGIMSILGEEMEIDHLLRIVRIKGTSGVTVGEPCIGYEIDAFFLALIISSTGKLSNKVWFSIFGLFLLVFVNLLRIITLTYLVEINPWLWEVNHKFVFSVVVYSVLFILWHLWIKFYAKDFNHE